MLHRPLSLCSPCRRSLFHQPLLFQALLGYDNLFHSSSITHRSAASAKKWKQNLNPSYVPHGSYRAKPGPGPPRSAFKPIFPRKLDPEAARMILNKELAAWTRSSSTRHRMKLMGVPADHSITLLDAFVSRAPASGYFPPHEDAIWDMNRIADDMSKRRRHGTDRALTRRFMAWALQSQDLMPPSVIQSLADVEAAADMSYPAAWYPLARAIRRKIIMHVGPTNSGKTHSALRALAAAPSGVYAGPLRLLAHEIFERLNAGSIVPAGANSADTPASHARACNLLTGEEQRIVSQDAALTSCTVEMLGLAQRFDVAVVDEIQMIADPERGGAWTAAVLGLCAREVHLCGEDSVVPLIEAIVKDTQDELIIHRYQRLTPLVVAPTSLKGDWTKIEKGDCVISFSRSGIFAIKKQIEEATGLRCAVAYGRLPPEVRSEQAALFNDPDSGFDVLVGSDAIGMGLNLKIKRIIFETTKKWDGQREIPLSLSQLKQIGGRAGRFGMNEDAAVPGVVTCLHDVDLPNIRKALSSVISAGTNRAVLPMQMETHVQIQQAIKPPAPFADVFDIMLHVSRIGAAYTVQDFDNKGEAAAFIDSVCSGFALPEKVMLFTAPVAWRDPLTREVVERFVGMYRSTQHVELHAALHELGCLEALDDVLQMEADGVPSYSSPQTLYLLESLHKVVVCYLWLSYRAPVVFIRRKEAMVMKEQTEKAIEYCLEGIRNRKAVRERPSRADIGSIGRNEQSAIQLLRSRPEIKPNEQSV